MTLTVLVAAWMLLAAVPFAWWAVQRRRVDVWRALPVPAALLDANGRVRDQAGPVFDVAGNAGPASATVALTVLSP